MGIYIAMIVASVILMIIDPKFGAFVCLLAVLSALIQWRHQKEKAAAQDKSAKKKSNSKKKSNRPRKKH